MGGEGYEFAAKDPSKLLYGFHYFRLVHLIPELEPGVDLQRNLKVKD